MVKIVKNPGNGRLNNLNDPVLNVLRAFSVKRRIIGWVLSLRTSYEREIRYKAFDWHADTQFRLAQYSTCTGLS